MPTRPTASINTVLDSPRRPVDDRPTVNHDAQVRLADFEYLRAQMGVHGEVLPKTLLDQGFQFQGTRVPLMGAKGKFKPRVLQIPISITTVPPKPNAPRP